MPPPSRTHEQAHAHPSSLRQVLHRSQCHTAQNAKATLVMGQNSSQIVPAPSQSAASPELRHTPTMDDLAASQQLLTEGTPRPANTANFESSQQRKSGRKRYATQPRGELTESPRVNHNHKAKGTAPGIQDSSSSPRDLLEALSQTSQISRVPDSQVIRPNYFSTVLETPVVSRKPSSSFTPGSQPSPTKKQSNPEERKQPAETANLDRNITPKPRQRAVRRGVAEPSIDAADTSTGHNEMDPGAVAPSPSQQGLITPSSSGRPSSSKKKRISLGTPRDSFNLARATDRYEWEAPVYRHSGLAAEADGRESQRNSLDDDDDKLVFIRARTRTTTSIESFQDPEAVAQSIDEEQQDIALYNVEPVISQEEMDIPADSALEADERTSEDEQQDTHVHETATELSQEASTYAASIVHDAVTHVPRATEQDSVEHDAEEAPSSAGGPLQAEPVPGAEDGALDAELDGPSDHTAQTESSNEESTSPTEPTPDVLIETPEARQHAYTATALRIISIPLRPGVVTTLTSQDSPEPDNERNVDLVDVDQDHDEFETAADRALARVRDCHHPPELMSSGPFTQDEEELVRRAIFAHKEERGLETSELVEIVQHVDEPTLTSKKRKKTTVTSLDDELVQDSRLLWAAVENSGVKRAPEDIRSYVRNHYHAYNTPNWTVDEDRRLFDLVTKYPSKWRLISVAMDNQYSLDNIKERWRYLDTECAIVWSRSEEMILKKAISTVKQRNENERAQSEKMPIYRYANEHIDWTRVSAMVVPRFSPRHCLTQWKKMVEQHPDLPIETDPTFDEEREAQAIEYHRAVENGEQPAIEVVKMPSKNPCGEPITKKRKVPRPRKEVPLDTNAGEVTKIPHGESKTKKRKAPQPRKEAPLDTNAGEVTEKARGGRSVKRKSDRPGHPSVDLESSNLEKRPRGRPRKHPRPDPDMPKRPIGRPRKHPVVDPTLPKKPLGRPRKSLLDPTSLQPTVQLRWGDKFDLMEAIGSHEWETEEDIIWQDIVAELKKQWTVDELKSVFQDIIVLAPPMTFISHRANELAGLWGTTLPLEKLQEHARPELYGQRPEAPEPAERAERPNVKRKRTTTEEAGPLTGLQAARGSKRAKLGEVPTGANETSVLNISSDEEDQDYEEAADERDHHLSSAES